MHLSGLPARQMIVVLVLTRDLIGGLARWLEVETSLSSESESLAVVSAALQADALSGRSGDAARRRAFHLSSMLAIAPTLGGVTSPRGSFDLEIELGTNCPALDYWTWLVACIGPKAPDA